MIQTPVPCFSFYYFNLRRLYCFCDCLTEVAFCLCLRRWIYTFVMNLIWFFAGEQRVRSGFMALICRHDSTWHLWCQERLAYCNDAHYPFVIWLMAIFLAFQRICCSQHVLGDFNDGLKPEFLTDVSGWIRAMASIDSSSCSDALRGDNGNLQQGKRTEIPFCKNSNPHLIILIGI